MKALKKLPEVGKPKSTVIYFPNCEPNKSFIPIPRKSAMYDKFIEFEIEEITLSGFGVHKGDLMTCRTNFSMSEITPDKFCIVKVRGEYFAKKVRINKSKNTIKFHCGTVENFDDVEFMAIAVELRKRI